MKIIILTILLLFFSLNLTLGCHDSCICDEGDKRCISCKIPNSTIDKYERSCPCPKDYYTSSYNPFECTLLQQYDINHTDITVQMKSCFIDMGMKTQYIKVETISSFYNENNISYIKVIINLNMNNISLNQSCQELYQTNIQYLNPYTQTYIDALPKYIQNNELGSKTITIPMIDLYSIAKQNPISNDEISQSINLQVQIGNGEQYLRNHKIDLIVYTKRQQTSVFTYDIDNQDIQPCLSNNQCITVADLDTTTQICSDSQCTTPKPNNTSYLVGNVFYAEIKFTDSTNVKYLKFHQLLFKDDSNKILDFTQITNTKWENHKLFISFPLVIPSIKGIIQVNLTIEDIIVNRNLSKSLFRNLQNNNNNNYQGNISQSKFKVTIVNDEITSKSIQKSSSNAAQIQDIQHSSSYLIHLKFILLSNFIILYCLFLL